MKTRELFALLLCLGVFFWSAPSHAHAMEQSYVFLHIEDAAVFGRIEINIIDLNTAVGISLATDHSVTRADIDPHIEVIEDYMHQHVSMAINGGSRALPLGDFSLWSEGSIQYLQLKFAFDNLPEEPRTIDFDYSVLLDIQPQHRGMAVIETNWKTGTFDNEANISLIFEPGAEKQTLDLSSSSVWSGFKALVRMGMHHIWIGIDHILFLLALLLPAVASREQRTWVPVSSFKAALIHVVKVVTVFTVAHTITLSFAALSVVTLSSRIVESIIAISIAIAAFDILVPIFRQRIWWIVFAFGLFHGFGFASVLAEIGIPPKYMVHSLLGFNLGVEIGQVAIVFAIFPILYLLSRHRAYVKVFLPIGATTLITISLYWFVERAFLIDLPAGFIVNSVRAWF